MPKCVLAFSGSLNTLVAIPWIKERHGMNVVTLSLDLGGDIDLEALGELSLESGATTAKVEDLREVFFSDFIAPSLRALAHYQTNYLLASALSRPLIARELVRVALEEGATHVAHCCSEIGNDQVRLYAGVTALGPHLQIISPCREWDFRTTAQRLEYARQMRLPYTLPANDRFGYDLNLWGQSIEFRDPLDPALPVPEDAYVLTKSAQEAPDTPEDVEVEFRAGLPCGLNGKRYPAAALIDRLNLLAGQHGIGRAEVYEDRLVGFKSREVYENPAAKTLYIAKRALEEMTLSRETLQVREGLSLAYGRCVYNGQWFSDLREALDAFYERINLNVSGTVTVRLYKGTASVIARSSEMSLYSPSVLANADTRMDSQATEGFTKVWSMQITAEARRQKRETRIL